jgi:7-cyano-7-deazaguanine synthase
MEQVMKTDSAIVLFSGGQDSTVCLVWALERFKDVITVGFDYGQTHSVELECRTKVLALLNPDGEDHVLQLAILNEISETALTSDMEITMQENGLPSTFVPGRNILFLTTAAMLAYRKGISNLVTGVCETDYSGYPDCRDAFIKSMSTSLSAGMDTIMNIHTPLMFIDKAETWKLAFELGGQELVELIIEETHTCYRGDRSQRHDWGYGCGDCPACELRKHGYETWAEAA